MFACLVCFCNRDHRVVHNCTRSKDHLSRRILACRGSCHHNPNLQASPCSCQQIYQLRLRSSASRSPKASQRRRRGAHIRSRWKSPQRALGPSCLDWNSWSYCRTMAGLQISKCKGMSRSSRQRERGATVSMGVGWRRLCLDAGWSVVFSYSNWIRGSCLPSIVQTRSRSSRCKAKACLRSTKVSQKLSRGPEHISHVGWILGQYRGLHTPTGWSSWSICRWT